MALSSKELAHHDKMVAMLPKLEHEYFKRPEITSLAVAIKIINGKPTDKLSFTFGVNKKLPLNEVKNPIPATIAGYPTDVEEFELIKFDKQVLVASRDEKTDPLIGGISISANGTIRQGGKDIAGNGTLGAMVRNGSDDRPFMITNAHVLAGVGTKPGGDVCQQSKWQTTLEYCHDCATLTEFYHENVSFRRGGASIEAYLDCAIARKGWFRNADIGKIYDVSSLVSGFAAITAGLLGKEVSKSGIKTGVTKGTITSIAKDVKIDDFDGKSIIAKNTIAVSGTGKLFSDTGDSGSVTFLTSTMEMVGLVFAGIASGTSSLITPSDAILSKWPNLSFSPIVKNAEVES
ncbi:hypothetical protein [Emticicia sp. 17c]|uniref:hypothetical protein n=1 Tax=Emticicia sp. 17c TaxID=3127704 RepID=UPI00301E1B40